MRKIFVSAFVLFLFALLVMPTATTFAAADASCTANPPSGPIGTVFVITCTGYDANTGVFAYLVEPTGTAVGPHVWGGGASKTDASGAVTYYVGSKFGNIVAAQYGDWHIAVEQLGLAKSVVHRGETSWHITGGTEGVDGAATLWMSQTTVHKLVDAPTLYGAGFAPFEPVSIWMEFARGQCATVTYHFPSGNETSLGGISVFGIDTVKADAGGSFAEFLGTTAGDNCEGTYHMVARGMTSGHGAVVEFIVTGNAIHPTIWMEAYPSVQSAEPGKVISFTGAGFQGGEHVSCWVTESRGHTVAVPGIYADAVGNIALSITTGAINSYYALGFPMTNSEGPLGEWHMTCRGDVSGLEGLATYTLVGGMVDP